MEKDIRTKHGKLIGKLDELTGIFSIKDGNKITSIEVPPSGLNLSYTVSNGIMEEVHIKLEKNTPQVA
jgi:hypothetical protein